MKNIIEIVRTVVECPIQTHCPFPNSIFKAGFDFMLEDGLIAAKADGHDDIVYSPVDEGYDGVRRHRTKVCVYCEPEECAAVFKRFNVMKMGKREFRMSIADCEAILGVSMWKLCDLVESEHGEELAHDVANNIAAREHTVVAKYAVPLEDVRAELAFQIADQQEEHVEKCRHCRTGEGSCCDCV